MADFVHILDNRAGRAALARHDVAEVYRMLCAAGATQAQIAKATGQRQSDIAEVLGGRKVTAVTVLERLADGLGIPRGWLGLAHITGDHGPGDQAPGAHVAEAPGPRVHHAPGTPAPGSLPGEAGAQSRTEDGRSANLLRHAATVLFGVPVFGPAEPIRGRRAATPRPKRIGLADTAWLVTTTARLTQLSDTHGGLATTDALTAHAAAGEALLAAEMSESVRHDLLEALADLHHAAATAASDAGLRDRAREHYARGMSCAGAAGDQLRVILHLRSEGRAELQFGEPHAALQILQLGVAAAPTELSRAVLECSCALALASLGRAAEADAMLRRALSVRQRVTDTSGTWTLIAKTMPHVEGCTQLVLGRFDQAVPALTAAIEGANHAVRCSTLNLTELATAQLRAGELRAGLQTAARVLDQARTLRSVWVCSRLAPLQQAAAARHDSACRDLARELAALRTAA